MNRERALNILNLPQNATAAQIKESYDQLRALYYPDAYGKPHEFTPQQIQEQLYKDVSHGHYKAPKGPNYIDFVPDAYHKAFYNYARVCQAYDYLTDPQFQNKFGVDPRSAYGHDVLRYGKTVAMLRKTIVAITRRVAVPAAIGYVVCGIIGLMVNRDNNVFSILSEVMKYTFLINFVVNCIVMPLDMLLLVPKMIWAGMTVGAEMVSGIFKPLAACVIGLLCGLAGVVCLFLFPGMAESNREMRYIPAIRNAKKGRQVAAQLYDKTLDNMRTFEGCAVDSNCPAVRNVIKQLAKEYKDARQQLGYTKASHDAEVERAGKNADMAYKFLYSEDWDSAERSWSKAYDERKTEVSQKEAQLRRAESMFYAFAYRAGIDVEEYLD